MPEPEPPATGIMQAASEAYRFQEIPRIQRTAPQVPTAESDAPPHMAPQFPGQQYLAPAAASPTGPAPYGGLGYYQHYPHAGNVDPYHAHTNFTAVEPPMAVATPQSRQPDPYAFAMPPRTVVEPTAAVAAAAAAATAAAAAAVVSAAAVGEGARKRAAEGVFAANTAPKRIRTDDKLPTANTNGHPG